MATEDRIQAPCRPAGTVTVARDGGLRTLHVIRHHGIRPFEMWADPATEVELYPSEWRHMGWELVA